MAEEGQVIGIHSVEEFDAQVMQGKASGKLIVVDFTASWCPPCRFIAPIFADLAKKFTEVICLKVDVDEVEDIAKRFDITAMPSFCFLQDEKEVHRIVGADKVELANKVAALSVSAAAATSAA